MSSAVLASARRVYARLFEERAGRHRASTPGLETAVIGDKVPGLDMLAIGPQIEFPHSPDERVSVPTVERFWRLLLGLLDDLSRPGGAAMSRAVVWILVVAGLVVLLGVTAAIGSRDERETVTAAEYADNVCGAVGTWRGSIEALVDDIRTPPALGDAGVEEPQSETPQGRTGYVRTGLERAVDATSTLTEAVARSGVPDSPQGEQVAESFQAWADGAETDLQDATEALDDEPDSLESALQATATAASAIGSTLTSGVQTVTEAARTDPELAAAFRDSDVCVELRADRGAP